MCQMTDLEQYAGTDMQKATLLNSPKSALMAICRFNLRSKSRLHVEYQRTMSDLLQKQHFGLQIG